MQKVPKQYLTWLFYPRGYYNALELRPFFAMVGTKPVGKMKPFSFGSLSQKSLTIIGPRTEPSLTPELINGSSVFVVAVVKNDS